MSDLILYDNNPFGGLFTKYEKYVSITTNADNLPEKTYYFVNSTINAHPYEDKENTYLQFNLKKRFIIPESYILEGRSYCGDNQLQNWEFSGREPNGNWEILDTKTDHRLKFRTVEHFTITKRKKYNAFRLQMRGKDSSDLYFLCIGSINIYGSIANNYCLYPRTCLSKAPKISSIFLTSVLMITLI